MFEKVQRRGVPLVSRAEMRTDLAVTGTPSILTVGAKSTTLSRRSAPSPPSPEKKRIRKRAVAEGTVRTLCALANWKTTEADEADEGVEGTDAPPVDPLADSPAPPPPPQPKAREQRKTSSKMNLKMNASAGWFGESCYSHFSSAW